MCSQTIWNSAVFHSSFNIVDKVHEEVDVALTAFFWFFAKPLEGTLGKSGRIGEKRELHEMRLTGNLSSQGHDSTRYFPGILDGNISWEVAVEKG